MKKLWFKARSYGWGWYPSSWEGFAVLGAWGFWVFMLFRLAHPEEHPVRWLVGLLGSIPVLILVCWKKGERPSWRWGGKEVPPYVVWMKIVLIMGVAAAVIAVVGWHLNN